MSGAARSVPVTTDPALREATFADAFEVALSDRIADAPAAARLALARMPSWVSGLMSLRNCIVRPLGLKAAPDRALGPEQAIGFFPVISQSPDRVVLGFDDRHLDFRIVIDVTTGADARRAVTATTFVKTHNPLGRAYLNAVLPFHRVIVPTLLSRVGRT
ncbi:MAG: DUF2867 domain-containing protein [Beijerinckiaceae bacterium]